MIELLEDLVKPERGGKPAFTLYHIHLLLRSLKREPLGRPSVSRILGLSDSSARTLLERLEKRGVVARSRMGAVLTEMGEELLEWLESRVRVCEAGLRFESWRRVAVLTLACLNPPVSDVKALAFRDILIASGCSKAIIGGIRGEQVKLPGLPGELEAEVLEGIRECLRASRDSLVVVVSADELSRAYNAVPRLAQLCS